MTNLTALAKDLTANAAAFNASAKHAQAAAAGMQDLLAFTTTTLKGETDVDDTAREDPQQSNAQK